MVSSLIGGIAADSHSASVLYISVLTDNTSTCQDDVTVLPSGPSSTFEISNILINYSFMILTQLCAQLINFDSSVLRSLPLNYAPDL